MSETRDNEIKKFVQSKYSHFIYKPYYARTDNRIDNLRTGYIQGYVDCIKAVQRASRYEGIDILDILVSIQSAAFELSEQKNESENDQK